MHSTQASLYVSNSKFVGTGYRTSPNIQEKQLASRLAFRITSPKRTMLAHSSALAPLDACYVARTAAESQAVPDVFEWLLPLRPMRPKKLLLPLPTRHKTFLLPHQCSDV